MRKLCDRRGETLTETLCAVLVLALAVALMASMIAASSRLDRKTDEIVGELYQAVSEAEKPEASLGTGSVSVQIGEDADATVPLTVEFYGDSEQVASYRVSGEGAK